MRGEIVGTAELVEGVEVLEIGRNVAERYNGREAISSEAGQSMLAKEAAKRIGIRVVPDRFVTDHRKLGGTH